MRFAPVLAGLLALGVPLAHGAVSGQAVSPVNASVAGGETQVFEARFFDGFGRPAAGERVRFANDTCGTFPNGGYFVDVTTDASGLASTTFRAMNQGITCWLTASAGVQVRFNVLTYVASRAYLSATLEPAEPKVGQSIVVEAAARYGLFSLYNADIQARVIPGTASALVTPERGNSGQSGSVRFTVTPDGTVGDYEIELTFRDRVQRLPVKAGPAPWQDLWWGGTAENGWGMSVVQHQDMLFSVIYAYGDAGEPTWYVMPGGEWNAARTAFSGPLYAPRGSPYSAYEPARFAVGAAVGRATITFGGGTNVTLDYEIQGRTGRKSIIRQPFGPVDTPLTATWGDMWWGGPSQNGWGIAVLQQYRTLFAVWFTYDAQGSPTWFVMPSGSWSDATTYEGRIYRATGSPWLAGSYDANAFRARDVGSFRLRFEGDAATFSYVIDGRSGSMPLARQPF